VIPRHRPPFSVLEFLAAQIGSGPGPLENLEAGIAEQLEMPHAILLPSARFGIWAGLKLTVPTGQAVAVPVLDCSAVHEAAIRSGLDTLFVDCLDNSFLMDLERMPKASAWVLSELYGQTYNLRAGPTLRQFCILDMAMTIPEKHLLERLKPSDLGLFSFGLGKSGYAGWGGVALTRDRHLAQELRRMVRDSCVESPPPWPAIWRTLSLGARVVAHLKPFYGFARKIQSLRLHTPQVGELQPPPDNWFREGTRGREWRRLPVRPELRMVAHNFKNFARNAISRRELEAHYRRFLQGSARVALPAASQGALSHFTVRIPALERERARQRLWSHGIDTGNLFGFPRYCDPATYPHAFKASQELINLPMDRGVAVKHVRSMAMLLEGYPREEAERNSNLS
jgi:dTDP-4-amino-4,6-dideoxygalactose transaminase